jgi:hypothetical protein
LEERNFCPLLFLSLLFLPPQFFVFHFAKCAAKEDVAFDPPNSFVNNAKKLPFFFTNIKYFGNIKLLEIEFFIYEDTAI